MLLCHESQKEWLGDTQGLDDIVDTMRQACAEVAVMSGAEGVKYAEGFRQHSHVGYSPQDKDLLSLTLGDRVTKLAR